jgi:deazaflavin-dependent oxidoreductase (nitroreductase family)
MAAMDWNQRIIREFRENNGRVGGPFDGAPLVLLTTQGRRTGRPHTTPAVYLHDAERGRYLVFASNAGAPSHPHWYLNLLAHPQVTMEIGTEAGHVRHHATVATPLDGEERDRFYALQAGIDPAFRDYQAKTSRTIPVVALQPLDLTRANPAKERAIGEQLISAHTELRAQLAAVRAGLAGADAAPSLGEQLRRHCLSYCHGLGLHHTREEGAFTAIEQRFPHLAPVIDRLREEHRSVAAALAGLQALLDADAHADAVRDGLERTVATLEEHFAYEEEHLLPALNVPRPA